MKQKKWLKILLPIVAVAAAGAIGLGIFQTAGQQNGEPVNVYPFEYIGMTEYWADSQESYGPVQTDKVQTVYLSETQSVVQVLVQPGDVVQKGDLLMVFDTTLSDLALERERLNVEKLKLQLQDAKDYLTEIKNMKPMVVPTQPETPEETEPNLGIMLTDPYQLSDQSAYDGSSPEKAMICWIREGVEITDELLEAVRLKSEEFRAQNVPEETEPTTPGDETVSGEEGTLGFFWPWPSRPQETEPTDPTEPGEIPSQPTEPSEDPTDPSEEPGDSSEPTESTEPADPTEPTDPRPETAEEFYVVFKSTEGNMSLGRNLVWQGMKVRYSPGNGYRISLYDASGLQDYTLVPEEIPDYTEPEMDFGSGFTSAQLAEMRAQQEKTIRDLEFRVKMAQADYEIKKTEVDSGQVYAQVDGTVVSLLSEEEAKMTMQPMLKISGGGGYYVEGTISELEKDNLVIGQEVTVNDWNTGMVYTGILQSVGDAPSAEGYWNGMGNPNTSYYPFTVYVDESADLQTGSYVSVVISAGGSENGIYLENPFLRSEQGRYYVYISGEDGSLEKRYVTTGKSLWGSYTEILSGITPEDLIAFPYGKNVREGAQTVESDLSALYEY